MMNGFLTRAFYFFSSLALWILGERMYRWKSKNIIKNIFSTAIFLTIFGLLCVSPDDYKYAFFPIAIVAWVISCEGNIFERVLKILTIFFLSAAINSNILVVLDKLFTGFASEQIVNMLSFSITLLLIMGFFVILGRAKIVDNINGLSIKHRIFFVIVLAWDGAMSLFMKNGNEIVGDSQTFLNYATLAELFLLFIVFFLSAKENLEKRGLLEQNELMDEIIRSKKLYNETVTEKDNEMRMFRHDIKNQLQLLRAFIDQGDYYSAKNQLNEITENYLNAAFGAVNVGNDTVNSILAMAVNNAAEKGVKVSVIGSVKAGREFDYYALCSVLMNAINNATRATLILCKEDVSVFFYEKDDNLLILVKNCATAEMYDRICRESTDKAESDMHGYGIKEIKRSVSKMKGTCRYLYDAEAREITLEVSI